MPSRTQIVCTIGPASKDPVILDQLIAHGMDVARLNFSWGTHDEHRILIENIRAAATRVGRVIPIIQDLAGPRVQTSSGHHLNPSAERIITEKDLADLDFGLSQQLEYICLSYVGSALHIKELRGEIQKRSDGTPANQGYPKIMAKVERKEALDNIEEIIKASDAIMLGRGDLGQSIPIEQVPFVEAVVIHHCKERRIPVIVATEMLKSMTDNPVPTRAEVTDIAYAIILGADAVMLSEETARGTYPVEAVTIMERVCQEAEKYERDVNLL